MSINDRGDITGTLDEGVESQDPGQPNKLVRDGVGIAFRAQGASDTAVSEKTARARALAAQKTRWPNAAASPAH